MQIEINYYCIIHSFFLSLLFRLLKDVMHLPVALTLLYTVTFSNYYDFILPSCVSCRNCEELDFKVRIIQQYNFDDWLIFLVLR
jgi:hypothetical protein